MLDDFFNDTVEAKIATYTNVKGTRTAAYEVVSVRTCVQPLSASRIHLHGIEGSQTGYTLWASAWPAGLGVGDAIDWPKKNVTLQVLAKPRDEGGAGQVFAVDCVELA